jgi:hypothetical protein
MSNDTDDVSVNTVIISNTNPVLIEQTERDEMIAARKKHVDARKEELIQVICRQTELNELDAKSQLEKCNYDCMIVLNDYFGITPVEKKTPSSTNQKIYGEIRNLMDTGAKQFRMKQERDAYIQQMNEARVKAYQDSSSNRVLQNT